MFNLIRKHRVFGLVLVMVFAAGAVVAGGELAKIGDWLGIGGVNSCLSKHQVFADIDVLTEEEKTIFSQNNIVFYEPCSGIDSGSDALSGEVSITGSTAEEKVWSGLRGFLSAEQAAGVMGNMAYENGTHGPVRREGGQSGDIWNSGTQMGMGLIQWSFGRRVKMLNYVKSQDPALIKYFEDASLGNMSGDEFIAKYGHQTANRLYQLELQYLKKELDTVPSYHGIYDQTTVDSAADYFLEHVEIPANIPGQRPLRREAAQKIYAKYADKTFTGNGATSSVVGVADDVVTSNLNDKAWELADQTREASLKGPTEAYLQAQKAVDCPGDCIDHGASCDRYVATVVRSAGVDDNIPFGNVATQEDYMVANPQIYTLVEGDAASESTYRPGDIRVKIVGGVRKHIEIYGQRGGKGYILSASISGPKRWAGYTDFFAESGAEYHIYRTQGTPKCITGNSCQKDTMNINATAVCLAWPLGTDSNKYECHGKYKVHGCTSGSATEAFEKAIDEVYGDKNSKNKSEEYHKSWSACPSVGASCDVGGGVVVRYSGVDKKFPRGLYAYDYAKKKSDVWQVLNYHKTSLEPGDVVEASENGHHHRWIYVEDEKGTGYVVESGLCHSFLHISGKYSKGKPGTWIYRAKNARNSTAGVIIEKGKSSVSGESISSDGSTSQSAASTSAEQKAAEGDINAAAIAMAWPLNTNESKYDLRKGGDGVAAWRKYYDSIYPKSKQTRGWSKGASCSVWVSSVLMYAGVTKDLAGWNNTPIHNPKGLSEIFEKSNDWEKVEVKQASDYKPGDVMIWLPGEMGGEGHAAIYVEVNGKGYTAQASKGQTFGHITDKVYIAPRVYRYKGKVQSTDYCDDCQNTNNESSTGLKEGGMSLAEAKEWMQTYRQEAAKRKRGSYTFKSAYVLDAGCSGGTLNNCVAFSQWFLNKYTSIGPKWANTVNGNLMVGHLSRTKGLKTGTNPRPYAIFSTGTYNHTGVVMGVTSGKVVVCEASCSNGYTSYWPGCSEWSMEQTKAKQMTYAYTDDIMNSNGGGVGNQ